jgi:hypothetical protein
MPTEAEDPSVTVLSRWILLTAKMNKGAKRETEKRNGRAIVERFESTVSEARNKPSAPPPGKMRQKKRRTLSISRKYENQWIRPNFRESLSTQRAEFFRQSTNVRTWFPGVLAYAGIRAKCAI